MKAGKAHEILNGDPVNTVSDFISTLQQQVNPVRPGFDSRL